MSLNAIVSFIIEVGALVVYGWMPFSYFGCAPRLLKVVLSLTFLIIFIVVWSRYAAPRSANRLDRLPLLLFKSAIFVTAAVSSIKLGIFVLVTSVVIISSNLLIEYREGSRSAS